MLYSVVNYTVIVGGSVIDYLLPNPVYVSRHPHGVSKMITLITLIGLLGTLEGSVYQHANSKVSLLLPYSTNNKDAIETYLSRTWWHLR